MTAASEKTGKADRPLTKWVDRLSIALVVPAAAATFLLMVHVIADVVGRNVFNHPLPSTLEIAQYWWMVLLVFGALGYAQLRGEHVRATIVTDRLPAGLQRIADVGALVLLAAFAVLIAYYGWGAAVESTAIRETIVLPLPVPVWPLRWAVPVCAAVLALQCLASIHLVLTRPVSGHDRPGQEGAEQ